MKEFKNAVWHIKKTPDGKTISKNIKVEIDGAVSFIPVDEANADYQEIQEWAKIDGNKIEEAD